MPTSLFPGFLVSTLGASAAILGLIEGIADGMAGIARLIGGALADDPGRRRTTAVGGYASTAILSMEAIEAVCTPPGSASAPILDGVASLADKSLLQHVEQHVEEEPRFIMLETIREYALERLESLGETEAARRAHATYFLAFAEETEQGMIGPQQAALLERLEQEYDNLRAAMQWSLEQAEEGKAMALRLGGALYTFWFVRAYFSEGRDFLERALLRSDEVAATAGWHSSLTLLLSKGGHCSAGLCSFPGALRARRKGSARVG